MAYLTNVVLKYICTEEDVLLDGNNFKAQIIRTIWHAKRTLFILSFGIPPNDVFSICISGLDVIIIEESFLSGTLAMKMTRVVIPAYKFRGDHALLECRYELNGDRYSTDNGDHHQIQNRLRLNFESREMNDDGPEHLYSVKWYKDNEEFYRYVPKANPPQQSYKVDGIRVDVSTTARGWLIVRCWSSIHFVLSSSTRNPIARRWCCGT